MLFRFFKTALKTSIVKKLCKRTQGLLKIPPKFISMFNQNECPSPMISSIHITLDSLLAARLFFCVHKIQKKNTLESPVVLLNKEAAFILGEPIIPPIFYYTRLKRIAKFRKLILMS